jgi:hypothetical protein
VNSAIQPLEDTANYSLQEIDAVELNAATVKGLADSQIRYVKTRVIDANRATQVAGTAIYQAAKALSDIKADVRKRQNWTALTESGALNMSGRMARDLVTAYDLWMKDADIPEHQIAMISIRVLARIGRVDAGKRMHAINKIKQGVGLVDSDLTKIIGNAKTQTRRIVDDLVLQAEKQAKKASDAEKLERFADLIIENARLKSQGDKQFDTLMQNNKELLQINDKLRKENRKLRNLIDEAAVEIDKARTVAKV